MPIDAESLYRQLGELVAAVPPLTGPLTPEIYRWLGRAAALVKEVGDVGDTVSFKVASDGLGSALHGQNAHQIVAILHRALARAEQNAPAPAQGAFIPTGGAFNAYHAIGKVLQEAAGSALIVDPYMNASVLTDFATLAREGVTIRLLTDSHSTKASALKSAADRWIQEYGEKRRLFVRFTSPRVLHDRLIMADGTKVWTLTQSLKDFAERAHASVLRVDGDMPAMKVQAYDDIWQNSTPMA